MKALRQLVPFSIFDVNKYIYWDMHEFRVSFWKQPFKCFIIFSVIYPIAYY